MDYKLKNSETKYSGRIFTIKQDKVQYPDGRVATLDIVEHHGAVAILAIDEDDQAWLVHQYRHPVKGLLLEIPAGVLEEGEDPKKAAQRELQEEIGMRAEKLKLLGQFYLAPGYSTEYMYIFLARQLTPEALEQDPDELIHVKKVPLAQLPGMIHSGELIDSKSIAALWFYGQQIGKEAGENKPGVRP